MWVEFAPADPASQGDGFRAEYVADKVLGSHAEMIEKRFGETWDKFNVEVMRGGARARRVLLWYFRMLAHAGYRIEDLPDYRSGELTVSFSVAELHEMRVRAKQIRDEGERDEALTIIDVQIAQAELEEATYNESAVARESVDTEGKAPSQTDGSATG